ncbi:MAG: AAA family ATPase [Janthinobacterium lividum]
METTSSENDIQVLQAVFSVCASRDVTAAAFAATENVPGAEFAGEFQEYITADRRPQFSSMLRNASSSVAIVDCDRDAELALLTIERLQQVFSNRVHLVAVSTRADSAFLVRAMRAGCNEFLTKPLDQEQFTDALRRFQAGSLANKGPQSVGRIISFYGVKGGVGTTTLAVHLAMHLVRKHGKRVLLIDHKHELGHVALHLGIRENIYNFGDLIQNVDRLDAELLQGFVTRHSSGLDVLPSPDTCAKGHEDSIEAIERVMDYLKRRYDFILLDSSMRYGNSLQALMVASEEVALISTPDLPALRDLARHIEHMNAMTDLTSKVRVVINRSTSDDAVTPSQIEASIRCPISLAVPNNFGQLLEALNAGEPIAPTTRGPFTQAISSWAARLAVEAPIEAPIAPRKSFFAFWN